MRLVQTGWEKAFPCLRQNAVAAIDAHIERVGAQILLWSSRPTTAQRSAVVGCLD